MKALLEAAAPQFTAAEALAIAEKWRKHWGDRRFDDSTDLIREDRDR